MPPAWVTDIFAAFMLVVAAASAARLLAARPWRHGAVVVDTDIAQILMAIAMAGMLASGLLTFNNTAWAVIFGVLTAWFGYRVVRDSRVSGVRALTSESGPHLFHGAAMLYMFLAVGTASASSMAGMQMAAGTTMQIVRYPTLAFILAVILIGYAAWDLDQLHGFRHGLAVALTPPPRPAFAGGAAGMGGTETGPAAFSGPAAGGGAAANSPASPAGTGRAPSPGAGGNGRSGAAGVLLSPGVTVGCRIVLGVTMALMLFLMI
jgi:Domain of unknown function (DUF5134)